MNQEYYNKKVLIVLDILMVLAVLSMAGAYALTNAMVIRQDPTVKVVEINPVASAAEGFEAPPIEQRSLMYALFFGRLLKFIVLGSTLAVYIYHRFHMNSRRKLIALCVGVCTWFTILFLGFWNDFGFWFGKILFGR